MTSTQAPSLPAEGITEVHADGRITHTMGSRYALAGMVYTAPLPVGAKVTAKVTIWNEAGTDCEDRTRTGIVTGAEYDGRTANWWVYEITLADGTVAHSRTPKVAKLRGERKASTPRAKVAKPDRATLPKIIAYVGIDDSGEYGNATCPHCGADGRYVHTFIVEGGQRRGAMAGCVKLFPISPVAEEHARIIERAKDRDKKGQALASWDLAKLAAIEACAAGTATEADTLNVIRSENAKRSTWMDRRNGRGRR